MTAGVSPQCVGLNLHVLPCWATRELYTDGFDQTLALSLILSL